MVDVTLSPVADTFINSNNATDPPTGDLNYSSDTVLLVGMRFIDGSPSFSRRTVLDFDVSTLTRPVFSAVLSLTTQAVDYGGAGNGETPHLQARRIIQSVVISEVTFNSYSTGNPWDIAGGRSIGVDVTSTVVTAPTAMLTHAAGTTYTIDVADLVNEARAASDTRLLIQVVADAFTANFNPVGFASMQHATSAWHPLLEITYATPWVVGRVAWGSRGAWH
jgi:hypothetical protein